MIGWIAIAVLTTALAGAVGRQYATNFSLPGTEAQQAQDLLASEFPSQSGDLDTIVFHTSQGTVHSTRGARGRSSPLLAKVAAHAPRGRGAQSLQPAGGGPDLP